jgi:hypothetical protein
MHSHFSDKQIISIMKKINLFILGIIFLFDSCSLMITTHLNKSYPPLDNKEFVKVFDLRDSVPGKSEELGIIEIGDAGATATSNCSYDTIIYTAKLEARKIGGNAIKIIEHISPHNERLGLGMAFYTCHSIVAKVFKVTDFNSSPKMSKTDSILINADYALLHLYRSDYSSNSIDYNLHLNDSVIFNTTYKSRKTLRVMHSGIDTIWAKTETKEIFPLEIQIGKEYYVHCGLKSGIILARPCFELVNNDIGKYQYESIKLNKPEFNDKIILKNGITYDCAIQKQDTETIYFSILKNGNEVSTCVGKDQIKEIQKGE